MPEIIQVKIDNLQTHPERYVSALELSEYLHVSDDLIYKLIDNGALSAVRVGRRVSILTDSARKLERDDGQGRE